MMRFVAAFTALALTGCSHVNTGQIDYRVAPSSPQLGAKTTCPTSSPRCVALTTRYGAAGDDQAPFKAKDVYSIEIEQIVVGDNILEGVFLGNHFDKSAEFGVLANVFEFAGDPAQASQKRFLQSGELEKKAEDPSDVELKLVYYGDDVRAFQPLNFSNIPLQQRSEYKGGSIGIQLVVLEVDTRSGPMASLLTTLARFGQQAIPVSSEVSDVLFDLGEALFSGGSGDDRLFEYRFVLSARPDNLDDVQAVFTPGRYVLRRKEQRGVDQNWTDVKLDLNTGRLVDNSGKEVRNEFYMVLNIRRYPEGTLPEHYEFEKWSKVRSALEAADPANTPLATLKTQVNDALVEQRSEQWGTRLSARWSLVESHLRALTSRHVPNLSAAPISACQVADKDRAQRRSNLTERNASDALREFVAEYQRATRTPAAGATDEFSAEGREALVSRVARYFMPWATGIEANFANKDSFATFVNDATNGLSTTALTTAKTRARDAAGCADLGNA